MSAETLRKAAALMRERANHAICPCGGPVCNVKNGGVGVEEMTTRFDGWTRVVDHYVGMSPAVALDMADWLDEVAWRSEHRPKQYRAAKHALAVARDYLAAST